MMLTLGYKQFQPYCISDRVVSANILFQFSEQSIREVSEFVFCAITIESTKPTSMEDVSTGVLEKIKKNIQEVKIKPKMIWCIKSYIIASFKIQNKWRYNIQYVKPTAQLVFKNRFSKGGPTCRRQVVNPRHQTSQGQSVAKPIVLCEWLSKHIWPMLLIEWVCKQLNLYVSMAAEKIYCHWRQYKESI